MSDIEKKVDAATEATYETPDTSSSKAAPQHYNEAVRQGSYWHAMMAVITSGCAFMSDGYQQGIMTPINLVLAKSYPDYSASYKTMVSNSNLVANIIGQIFFGLVGDRIGRKQGFTLTTALIVIGSIVAACAKGTPDSKLFWVLIIARGIAGVGIGGEYPVSGASSMEAAEERLDGDKKLVPFICSTNLPISLGLPFASCIFLIFQAIWGQSRYNPTWRSCFAFGAVFPTIIFYFRWKLDHAKMFKEHAIKRKVPYGLVFKRYWRELLGVAGTWFWMDLVIYPNNIFSSSILTTVIPGASIRKDSEWLLLLGFFATIGSIVGMIILPWFTRRQIILLGFFLYAVLSFVVGGCFDKLLKIPGLFVTFYALMNLVIYAGPANMQSVIATESFATPVRATLYGLSAGIGKAGAAIGTEIFTPIQNKAGKKYTFFVSGGACFLGMLMCYLWVPETGTYNLPEKDREFNEYLLAHGWTGNIGEGKTKHAINEEEDGVHPENNATQTV